MIGFLMMFGAVGLSDSDTSATLFDIMGLASVGLVLMLSGSLVIREKELENK
jgi:hypothetical protein